MSIQENIKRLVTYGLITGLIEPEDRIYTTNRLLELFRLDAPDEDACTAPGEVSAESRKEETGASDKAVKVEDLEDILAQMLDYAYGHGLMEDNSIVHRDLFDTKIMGLLVPRPSEVIRRFEALKAEDPKKATDYFYKFSQDTDYIRRYRIAKDRKWVVSTEYGDLDITINLSKPEKDPKAIAAADRKSVV